MTDEVDFVAKTLHEAFMELDDTEASWDVLLERIKDPENRHARW